MPAIQHRTSISTLYCVFVTLGILTSSQISAFDTSMRHNTRDFYLISEHWLRHIHWLFTFYLAFHSVPYFLNTEHANTFRIVKFRSLDTVSGFSDRLFYKWLWRGNVSFTAILSPGFCGVVTS